MKLYMSDLYRVELHYPLDEVQTDILYYLYQPLIGSDALQLYMMLVIEGKRMNRFLKPSSLSRLTSFLSIKIQFNGTTPFAAPCGIIRYLSFTASSSFLSFHVAAAIYNLFNPKKMGFNRRRRKHHIFKNNLLACSVFRNALYNNSI